MEVRLHSASRGNFFIAEVGQRIGAALADVVGVSSVTEVFDQLPGSGERPGNTVDVIVGPHEYFPLIEASREAKAAAAASSVMITMEQPQTPWFQITLEWARLAPLVLDISTIGAEALVAAGVDARHVPLGYHHSWDAWQGTAGNRSSQRDIDLVFMGGPTTRRAEALANLAPILVDRSSRLLLHDPSRPVTAAAVAEGSGTFVAGHSKDALLARTGISLNLHRDHGGGYFEWQRALDAIHNGALLVTEPSAGVAPLQAGDHFLVADFVGDPAALRAHVLAALLDVDMQTEVTRSAHEFIRSELDMTAHLTALWPEVAACAGLRSVASETPVFRDIAAVFPDARAIPLDETPGGDAAAAKQAKLVAREQRRADDRARSMAEHGAELVVTETRSAAWETAVPDVSVVIPLYDYARFVGGAIESALASEPAPGGALTVEVVIVDDHSTDDGGAVVGELIERRPDAAIRLLARSSNGGLGAARNMGIEAARADRVFLLDADNEIYPTALARLHKALDGADQTAFAYSILEVFGDESSLLSTFPYSPERLLIGPYIDAMAMVRKSAWAAVGGYDESEHPDLHGWEDHAFWLALLDQGLGGVQVPELLCRYRRHGESMITTSNLDNISSLRHLRTLYPNLAWPT